MAQYSLFALKSAFEHQSTNYLEFETAVIINSSIGVLVLCINVIGTVMQVNVLLR